MGGSPWGGSEELWTRTAVRLARQGIAVSASFHGWPQLDQRISELSRAGIDLHPRPVNPSFVTRARRYVSGQTQIVCDIDRSFRKASPRLVLISSGSFANFQIELVEMCIAKRWPLAIVAHSNSPGWWPSDQLAARFRNALSLAQRIFFVSKANRALAEKQLGYEFENAAIVRNPLVIEFGSPLPWPPRAGEQELRMACVGNLFPTEKGQDIVFDVLATPKWRERNWRLTLYGNGPNRGILERLVATLKLENRVTFAGYVAVDKIWGENHILLMPSRYEGMPLTIVEAMFCGRPVVATNVGGNSELIENARTGFLAEAAVAKCFGDALERMWSERDKLDEIGKCAAASIREFLSGDPVGEFAKELRTLANSPK